MIEDVLSKKAQEEIPLAPMGEVRERFSNLREDSGIPETYRLNRHLLEKGLDILNLDQKLPESVQNEIALLTRYILGHWKKRDTKGNKKITLTEILRHMWHRWQGLGITEVQQSQIVFHAMLSVGQHFRDQIEQYLITKDTDAVAIPDHLYRGHIKIAEASVVRHEIRPIPAEKVVELHAYHRQWLDQDILLESAQRAMAVLVGVEKEVSWDALHQANAFEYMQTDIPSQLIKKLVAKTIGNPNTVRGKCLAVGVRHGVDLAYLMEKRGDDIESIRWTEGSQVAIDRCQAKLSELPDSKRDKITPPESPKRMTAAIESEIEAGRTYDLIHVPLGLQFGNEETFIKKLSLLYRCLNPGGMLVFGLEEMSTTTMHGIGIPISRDSLATGNGSGKNRSAVTYGTLDQKSRIHAHPKKIQSALVECGFTIITQSSVADSDHLFEGQNDADMLYFAVQRPPQ